jgi:large subunit ribosomal protein L24
MAGLNIRKNDTVKVIAGRDKGKQGKVLGVYPEQGRVLVEQVMMVKRHTRPNPNRQIKGGIAEHEAPIAISNVMVVCPECGPTKVVRTHTAEGKSQRVCKKCKRNLD